MSSVITLTTDFGEGSSYVAQLKGVLLSLNPQANLVDLSHAVPPQDVCLGALVLADCCPFFPPETIHLAVVDPGVGTDRALIAVRAGRHWFVAPDNGLLTLVVRRSEPTQQVRLAESRYWLDEPSSTFHGRDIMAPVAAHLSLGVPAVRLGPPLGRLVQLDWSSPQLEPGRITGSVIAIDSFGNVITNIERSVLPAGHPPERIQVLCRDQRIDGLVSTYGERSPAARVALIGSSGRLELAMVNGNAARQLRLKVGDAVIVRWS